jgi:nuclear pore complex protein Nup107
MESTLCVSTIVHPFPHFNHSPKKQPPQCEDDTADEDDLELEAWSGNRNRKLWKQTCIRAALSEVSPSSHLPPSKIKPNPPPSSHPSPTKNVSSTLPSYPHHKPPTSSNPPVGRGKTTYGPTPSVICKEKVSSELGSLTRADFWEGGQEAVENDNVVAMDNAEHFYCRPRIGEGLGNGGVYRSLESLKAVAIVDGCVASCFFPRVFT